MRVWVYDPGFGTTAQVGDVGIDDADVHSAKDGHLKTDIDQVAALDLEA
ncbi:MAG: hypothetical protein ACJA00_001063 [Myxococcota bacterium]|jgi:hypothetical protein